MDDLFKNDVSSLIGSVQNINLSDTGALDSIALCIEGHTVSINIQDIKKFKRILGMAEDILTVRQETALKDKNLKFDF